MATEAQISANKENSQKSTGPRTAKGKKAVSQNAVKHGFFTREAVVRDEDQAAFDLYREAMLAEMGPVGVMESSLAERVASLSWRLRRAERMQDQALKMQLKSDMLDLVVRQVQWSYRDANGLEQEESQPKNDYMTFGRAARNDIASFRVLDRLLLYERRIENSMHKTMKELGKLQAARKAEQACAGKEQSAQESPPAKRHSSELKKQSQFASAMEAAKAYRGKSYDAIARSGTTENKPKQSQTPAFARQEEARNPKSETMRMPAQ
jgi:hypothetical protein